MKRMIAAAALVAGFSIQAPAALILSHSAGNVLTKSASADFDVTGDVLTITFTNTATSDVLVPVDVLTGMFFDIAGDPTLTPQSVILGVGSSVLFPPSGTGTNPGGDVGSEFDYAFAAAGIDPLVFDANYGIGTAGMGVFGPPSDFTVAGGGTSSNTNLQGPVSIDGLQYGITSAGDNPLTGNTPVTGKNGLIQNSVVITLLGATGIVGTDITNITYVYGTALGEGSLPDPPPPDVEDPAAPEPSSLALLSLGAVGLMLYRRRKHMERVV